jgi:hypothetical protein
MPELLNGTRDVEVMTAVMVFFKSRCGLFARHARALAGCDWASAWIGIKRRGTNTKQTWWSSSKKWINGHQVIVFFERLQATSYLI